jgi:hypothetical protein
MVITDKVFSVGLQHGAVILHKKVTKHLDQPSVSMKLVAVVYKKKQAYQIHPPIEGVSVKML